MTENAHIIFPITINGLNLPNLVFVLSINPPKNGSVIPSKIRIAGTNKLVNVETANAHTPDMIVPPIAFA